MRSLKLIRLLVVFTGTSLGCGGSHPPPEAAQPAPAPSPSAPASAAPPTAEAPSTEQPSATKPTGEKPWKDKNRDERLKYMKEVVLPKMGSLFKEFDSHRFAEVKCTTCHGSGMKTGTFAMPNPELPKLRTFDAEMKEKPKIAEFMAKTVVPQMATLLDLPPFDPATKQGFGCGNCHTFKK